MTKKICPQGRPSEYPHRTSRASSSCHLPGFRGPVCLTHLFATKRLGVVSHSDRRLTSPQNPAHQLPVHIRETEIPALVAEGKALVIQPQQVQ